MKKIKDLMKEYIEINYNPIKSKKIVKVTKKVLLVPQNKWDLVNNKTLEKKFYFSSNEKRNNFIEKLFEYENKKNHHAVIIISEDIVKIILSTKNLSSVTELDKEYASYADSVFSDLMTEWKKNEKFKFIPC